MKLSNSSLLFLLSCFLFSGIYILQVNNNSKELSKQTFLNHVESQNSIAIEKVKIRVEALNGLVRFFSASEYINENEFKTYSSDLLRKLNLQSICFSEKSQKFSITSKPYKCEINDYTKDFSLDEKDETLTLNKRVRSSSNQTGWVSIKFSIGSIIPHGVHDLSYTFNDKKKKELLSNNNLYTSHVLFLKNQKHIPHSLYFSKKENYTTFFTVEESLLLFFIIIMHAIIIFIIETNINTKKIIKQKVDTQTKIIEDQQISLAESSRLSSLGEMASGIAHEINNPLSIISTTVSLINKSSDKDLLTKKELSKNLSVIQETIKRISLIIIGLKNLSRHDEAPQMSYVSIEEMLKDVLTLSNERFYQNGIEVILPEPPTHYKLLCNRAQTSQVFINLISNSFDAISHLPEKWIKIEFEDTEQNLLIRFIDSGTGIKSEVASKIFNPFYTTKEEGRGTGIGLSISMSILKKSGASMYLDSSNKNTCIVLSFPKDKIK